MNYPKYHYKKQIYKRNTGWYDHNAADDLGAGSTFNDNGCLVSLIIIGLGFVALAHAGHSGSFLSWVGAILLMLAAYIGTHSID